MFLKHRQIRLEKEEWTGDDQANRDSFVMTSLAKTIEKGLRNRIRSRDDDVRSNLRENKDLEAKKSLAQIEELEDILTEWENIRTDITNHEKNLRSKA